jgi:hypothetical protein
VITREEKQAAQPLEAELAELIRLVEEHRVEEARRLAPELAARYPNSAEARHWARVLEPPRILPNSSRETWRRTDAEHEWLREHAHEYPGCWLAVHGERLIASGPDLQKVVAAVRTALGEERALLHFQPADPS